MRSRDAKPLGFAAANVVNPRTDKRANRVGARIAAGDIEETERPGATLIFPFRANGRIERRAWRPISPFCARTHG
jgi:hypothetical protein